MAAGAGRRSQAGLALWSALCALLACASAVAWLAGGSDRLVWRADDWLVRPWTLWSASWVHRSAAHWLANLLALAAIAVLGQSLRAGRAQVLALLTAWPLATLALLCWPEVRAYYGLSGLIHAAVGVLCVHLARTAFTHPLTLSLLAGLVVKLALEQGWAHPIGFDDAWGFNVVYVAHLIGAMAGLLCGALWSGDWARRPATVP